MRSFVRCAATAILMSLSAATVVVADGGPVAGRRPDVRLISRERDLSDAEFRRLQARLEGSGRAAVARALGEPDVVERSSVEDCEGWTYRVGGGRLLVVMYGGRNCWLIHHPE
jgi:hypothetical protein